MSETELVSACVKYLRWKGHYCQRIHSGLIKQVLGKAERWIHLADKGTPDIIACVLNSNGEGRFLGLEVKRDEKAKKVWHRSVNKSKGLKPLSKSDMTAVSQYEQMNLIERAGGYTALVASIKELEHVIKVITEK